MEHVESIAADLSIMINLQRLEIDHCAAAKFIGYTALQPSLLLLRYVRLQTAQLVDGNVSTAEEWQPPHMLLSRSRCNSAKLTSMRQILRDPVTEQRGPLQPNPAVP